MSFTKINAAGIGSTETITVNGLSVIGDGSFGGNVSVAGTLTYEDVTNVDSVGLNSVGPAYTLDVDGDINSTGSIRVNGVALSVEAGATTADATALAIALG